MGIGEPSFPGLPLFCTRLAHSLALPRREIVEDLLSVSRTTAGTWQVSPVGAQAVARGTSLVCIPK